MQEQIWHGVAGWRRFLWVGPGWMIVFLLLASCSEGRKHEVLTFFFDGVPPLPTQVSARTPVDPNARPAGAASVEKWRVHEPVKDCTQCHGHQPRRVSSSKAQLVAPVPQLCYQCHSRFSALEGWVHGPVAAGDCLLCHQPHRTRTEALLRSPVPELCYQCHETRAIHLIEKHDQPSYTHCTDCHDGHASLTKPLLRPAVVAPRNEARGDEAGIASGRAASPLPKAGEEAKTRGQDTLVTQVPGPDALATRETAAAELYYRSIRQFHAGQLREAREGFFEALKTGLLPGPMRETAHGYLEKIDEALKESPEPERRLPP